MFHLYKKILQGALSWEFKILNHYIMNYTKENWTLHYSHITQFGFLVDILNLPKFGQRKNTSS